MKIEIAESLIFSWLRHTQGCVVTQMNWKPSPGWPMAGEDELRQKFEGLRTFAAEAIGFPIFKQYEFAQFVRQAEIDVLGLRPSQHRSASQAIAVDSAFHEAGLNYGGADETVGRVLKKLVRAAVAIEGYLEVGEATIIFATPKVAEPIREAIERHLVSLENAFAEDAPAGPRLHFRLIANRAFSDEILQPVLEATATVADTSELFMRALQLTALCEKPTQRSRARCDLAPGEADPEEKIGAHVRATMAKLARSGRLTPEVIGNLLNARYCKLTFNLGLPFLKAIKPRFDLASQRMDERGYGRYWKYPLNIGDAQFLMCSQWFVWQRAAFDRWVRDLG